MPETTAMETAAHEDALRRALGIPADAERVLVLGESSHWDPNWLLTSDEYYRLRIRRTLDRAVDALERDARRVYSIECVFFLKMYWEREPGRRDTVRRLVNERRLRLTGCAMTTPDTLLPSTEAILRDYLLGQEWLRMRGMIQEPAVAYLPDNFGNSPALPSILRALGVTGVAFARLDGAYFPGCDYRPRKDFPLLGSSTARLEREERSLDFLWRDGAGAEVVARFHAFGYGQGDLLAHRGLTRWMAMPLAFPARSEEHVAARIAGFVEQLAPLARTPYLFCPIGFDFVDPIHDLGALIERYNRVRYPTTGVFVVNAALDDFIELVSCHRSKLPVIELEPNPYWTGFYASRPTLKAACRRLVDDLVEAESIESVRNAIDDEPISDLRDPWFQAVFGNHHDFITGTSPDRVHRTEQAPRIAEALAALAPATARIHDTLARDAATPRAPTWLRVHDRIEVRTERLVVEIDEERGGCITKIVDARTGVQLLGADSFDLLAFHDTGGLWRMGHEFRGGAFDALDRVSARPVKVDVRECRGAIAIVTRVTVAGDPVERTLWIRGDQPVVRVRVEGRLSGRRTLLVRVRTPPLEAHAVMAVPGGVAERPFQKLYEPTFWPADRAATFRTVRSGSTLVLRAPGPASIAFDPCGTIDCVALRNATRERAFGFLPLLGFPASGHEDAPSRCDLAMAFDSAGEGAFDDPWNGPDAASRRRLFESLVTTDVEGARLLAVKRASRGEGTIVRLTVPAARQQDRMTVSWAGPPIVAAWRCDARERDLAPLEVRDGAVAMRPNESIVSLRFVAELP